MWGTGCELSARLPYPDKRELSKMITAVILCYPTKKEDLTLRIPNGRTFSEGDVTLFSEIAETSRKFHNITHRYSLKRY